MWKKYYKSKQSSNNFDTTKRFLQWSYYEWWLGMIFIILWIILILLFAITASLFTWCKLLILIIWIISIWFGFYIKDIDDKKKEKWN